MSDVALVLIVILVLVVLWRGPKTLPSLGKALGRGVREARDEIRDATGQPAAGDGSTASPDDRRPPAA